MKPSLLALPASVILPEAELRAPAAAPASAADTAANNAADADYRAKATAAAIRFEGFFIAHMLREMRAGTRELADEDSVFKNSVNSDMLDLADSMLADKMAGQRAFGIADAILRQLLPAPAAAVPATATAAASSGTAATASPKLPEKP